MEELSRNPVHGAVWRELNCCITLGVKYQFMSTLALSLLPENHAKIFKFIAILYLVWRSITKYEMISGGPYTVPNAVQRFSVSTLLLILVLNVLGYVPFPDGAIYLPLKGLPLESELTTFFTCLLLFLGIRSLWNFAILATEGWAATRNLVMVADPIAAWDRAGHAVLETGSKLSMTLRRVMNANEAHMNWILFNAMDVACLEVDCLLVVGLTGSILFIIGLSCLQFTLGLNFPFLLILYCVGTLKALNAKCFYVATVSCRTPLRFGVRFSINLALLGILLLMIPRHAERSPGMASFAAFLSMRLVHLARLVWNLGVVYRGWCWWTWSPEAQSKLSLVPLALCFILLKLYRKGKAALFGLMSQCQKANKVLKYENGIIKGDHWRTNNNKNDDKDEKE